MIKRCNACKIEKNVIDFYKGSSRAKYSPECKVCTIKRNQMYVDKNPDKYFKALLKREYNISLEQFNEMKDKQDNKCFICGLDGSCNKDGRLHVDHNHKSGKIRGLLCNYCNRGIGLLKDSSENCFKAAEYLRSIET